MEIMLTSIFRKTECIKHPITGVYTCMKPLVAQTVKNLPAMQESQVLSLGWEDSLEKGMASHSSILAWKILWTEKPGGLESMGLLRVGHNWVTNTFTFTCIKLKNTACSSRLLQQTFNSLIGSHSANLSSVCPWWKLRCRDHFYYCHHCCIHCDEHQHLRAYQVPAATLLSTESPYNHHYL